MPLLAFIKLLIFVIATSHMSSFLYASNYNSSISLYNCCKSILTLIFANLVSVSMFAKNSSISFTKFLRDSLKMFSSQPYSNVEQRTLCILFRLFRMFNMYWLGFTVLPLSIFSSNWAWLGPYSLIYAFQSFRRMSVNFYCIPFIWLFMSEVTDSKSFSTDLRSMSFLIQTAMCD